jgi:ribosomal protein S14
MAFAPLVIRWRPDTSSDKLRQRARCTACGHKGASLRHPSWVASGVDFQPFPD